VCEREAQEYQEARVRQLKVRSQDERMNERSFRRERDLQQNIWDCLKKQSKLSLRKIASNLRYLHRLLQIIHNEIPEDC